jgi:putative radical SAM enzyme (TIGR03279 family)
MPVRISGVAGKSPCAGKGVGAGDTLVSVNGHEIADVLDYRFYISEERLNIEIITLSGRRRKIRIKKSESEDPGLLFETYLMDNQRRCKNSCIFCFIDQLPKGLRESLYFKDDDSRLSFLFGNYITLTNLTRREADRIISMHISPVNVSVHTMDPKLRVKMMGNRFAGECLSYLKEFADSGIKLNTQLVLCPGINDGAALEYSLSELFLLYPSVQSIAAVPVGLTKHREGLYKLHGYTPEQAARVIDTIDAFNKKNAASGYPRIAFAADEFYIKAGREMPGMDYYGDFPQLENGVGMWTLFREDFLGELNDLPAGASAEGRKITLATGEAAYPLMLELSKKAVSAVRNLDIDVVKIENTFFGDSITVSGLITGGDFLNQLSGRFLGDELLIPLSSLRREGDMFLDDMTVSELCEKLGVPVRSVSNSGQDLLLAMLGE